MTTALITSSLASHLISHIEAAEQSIWTAQYLANTPASGSHIVYKRLWQAMEAAPKRGLQCVAVIDKPNESETAYCAAERAARRLAAAGWQVAMRRVGPRLHCKAWVFDESVSIVGSHNLAHQSMLGGSDLSLLSTDGIVAAGLVAHIMGIINHWQGPDYGKGDGLF